MVLASVVGCCYARRTADNRLAPAEVAAVLGAERRMAVEVAARRRGVEAGWEG